MEAPTSQSRRKQTERTASTKAALADAAIEILLERGWAAVTAIEVCRRAGVTRGAFHHHYDNLPQLLADALRQLYAPLDPATNGPAVTDLTAMINATWKAISQPKFKAIIEAWLAMANDPTLSTEIGPVVAEFANMVQPNEQKSAILRQVAHRRYYLMARETMLGLALGRAINGGQALPHERDVLLALRSGAKALDETTAKS